MATSEQIADILAKAATVVTTKGARAALDHTYPLQRASSDNLRANWNTRIAAGANQTELAALIEPMIAAGIAAHDGSLALGAAQSADQTAQQELDSAIDAITDPPPL